MRACVRACVYVYRGGDECVCVCVRERERESVWCVCVCVSRCVTKHDDARLVQVYQLQYEEGTMRIQYNNTISTLCLQSCHLLPLIMLHSDPC